MRKIKVLRIIARLNIGGPAIHTVLLTSSLDNSRFESLLACGTISKGEGDMSYYAREKQIQPYSIPELQRELSLRHDLIAFKKIYCLLMRFKPDILHTHTAKAGTLGRLAGIAYNATRIFGGQRVRIVHTFHGHVLEGYFSKLSTRMFILIEQVLAVFTDRIITVSDSVKNELLALGIGNNKKIAVIPLGFELDRLLSMPAAGRSEFCNVGIVGRLVPIKNQRLFLEAAEIIFRADPTSRLRFKIIGDGELRHELESYCRRRRLVGIVQFLGWQDDLPGIYRGLQIVALTSLNEGTPVSLIEAMAAGRAAVATDVGGVADLFGKAEAGGISKGTGFTLCERGILIKSRDSDSLAQALALLSGDEVLRKKLGVCARDFIKDNFTKDRLVKDLEDLYESMI